jgi:hypothetical protein
LPSRPQFFQRAIRKLSVVRSSFVSDDETGQRWRHEADCARAEVVVIRPQRADSRPHGSQTPDGCRAEGERRSRQWRTGWRSSAGRRRLPPSFLFVGDSKSWNPHARHSNYPRRSIQSGKNICYVSPQTKVTLAFPRGLNGSTSSGLVGSFIFARQLGAFALRFKIFTCNCEHCKLSTSTMVCIFESVIRMSQSEYKAVRTTQTSDFFRS